jgi:subtilisin family serine protease
VEGVLSSFGDGDDLTIGYGLERAVDRITPDTFDVIIMSLGTYTDDDTPPPLSAFIDKYVTPATVLVAAAGNEGSCRPYYPAALPDVVAVGALDSAGRAWFSNFGPWVDACAPGVDVVSTYFSFVESTGPGRTYEGWAAWSGTSFSAPKIAAAIAQDMYVQGDRAVDAWRRLSSWQKYRYPDLGIVFNVL